MSDLKLFSPAQPVDLHVEYLIGDQFNVYSVEASVQMKQRQNKKRPDVVRWCFRTWSS